MKTKKIISFFIAFLFLLAFSACSNKGNKKVDDKRTQDTLSGEIMVFHAGSLSLPLKEIAEEFNKLHPNVKIDLESGGSVASARKITDLNRSCDIFASADYKIIDEMLIPDYTDFNIKFAGNEMAIVYTEKSKFANEINDKNWTEILLNKEVRYGRSDPNSDPCGYRAVLVSKLAEKFYHLNDFSEKLLAKDNKFMRPKETDLLALLETGTVDYIFLYRSVAQQHKLPYLILPDSINLKKFDLKDFYAQVETSIRGKKKGEKIIKKGAPMVYGISLMKKAGNNKAALAFFNFILGKSGADIIEENGQTSLIPSVSESYDSIPEQFKKYALQN